MDLPNHLVIKVSVGKLAMNFRCVKYSLLALIVSSLPEQPVFGITPQDESHDQDNMVGPKLALYCVSLGRTGVKCKLPRAGNLLSFPPNKRPCDPDKDKG